MRKTLFSAALALAAIAAHAQLVEVASVKEVNLPQNMVASIPTISPDGSFVVISDAGTDALTKVNIADGATQLITTNGNGHDVTISADGSRVVFRQNTIGTAATCVALPSKVSKSLQDSKPRLSLPHAASTQASPWPATA